MKKAGLFIIILYLSAVGYGQLLSPTVVSSAGGFLSNGNVSVSFTLGEIAVTTLQGSNLILTQGFQQPFELDVGTGVGDIPVNWAVEAYPNPVTGYLNIRFSLDKEEDFLLQISDLSGRKLVVKHLYSIAPGSIETVDCTGFSPGLYLITITSEDQKIRRMYKIEKR